MLIGTKKMSRVQILHYSSQADKNHNLFEQKPTVATIIQVEVAPKKKKFSDRRRPQRD